MNSREALRATVVAAGLFAVAPAMAAKTTLQVWDWYPDRMEVLKPKIAEYEKLHPDIKINASIVSWPDYPDKVLSSVIAGAAPEIIQFHNAWTGRLLSILSPFPQELFNTSRMADEYYQFNTAFRMSDGKFRFFPDGLMSAVIFYNKRLWTQSGLADTPKTWDELRLAAKKLARFDGASKMTQMGFEFAIQNLFDDLNYQMGGGLYNAKHTGVDWLSDEGRKAMDLLSDMAIKDRIKPMGKDGVIPFEAGKVGMFYSWSWVKSSYLKVPASKLQWSAFSVPTPSGSETAIRGRNNYECGYAVPANLKGNKKVEAFKFLKWLYSDDAYYLKLNDVMGRLPGKKSLWTRKELTDDAVQGSMVKTIPFTVFPGERPGWVADVLGRMETNIVTWKLSPIDALKRAQEEGDKQWKIMAPKWIVERRLPK